MYLRKTTRRYKDKTYANHLLVESIQTPKGPRQRIICSLGSLEPAPAETWHGGAHKLEAALQGQAALPGTAPVDTLAEQARRGTRRAGLSARACVLTEAMTLNRLIAPRSEHAMPDWMPRTAVSDILRADLSAP